MRCISASVLQAFRREKAFSTRMSSAPERSSATMVFSKLGAAGFAVMTATSASSARMPASKAGR